MQNLASCKGSLSLIAIFAADDPTNTVSLQKQYWKNCFTVSKAKFQCFVGLAIGIALMELPWEVIGITLAGPASYYMQQEKDLSHAFASAFGKHVMRLAR